MQVFWGLDKKLAQRKHFPSLNWLISYTKYMRVLEPYYNAMDPDFLRLRTICREILQQEDGLTEIVQLVGRESLSDDQKCVMDIARIIREDFLQQNAFTSYDFKSPVEKSVGMLKCVITLYEEIVKALRDGGDRKMTYAHVRAAMQDTFQKVIDAKFVDPKMPGGELAQHYGKLAEEIKRLRERPRPLSRRGGARGGRGGVAAKGGKRGEMETWKRENTDTPKRQNDETTKTQKHQSIKSSNHERYVRFRRSGARPL